MYIKHFLKSSTFFKNFSFFLFSSPNVRQKPPTRKAYHRFIFLYVVHPLGQVFGRFSKIFIFLSSGIFLLKKKHAFVRKTQISQMLFEKRSKGSRKGGKGLSERRVRGVRRGAGGGADGCFLKKQRTRGRARGLPRR